MNKLESIMLNETQTILRDFEIQIGYLILVRNQTKGWLKKEKEIIRTYHIVGFDVLVDHRVRIKENEKKDK